MKKIFFLLGLLMPVSTWAKDAVVTIINEHPVLRHEVVELDASVVYHTMGVEPGQSIIVRNSRRQQVAYQLTKDGKLLVDVAVRPKGTATFTVSAGEPMPMKQWVAGAMYTIRKDDIAWENDRCCYRVYGPALQRTGEKSFGTDIWVKNTPDLVVAERYRVDDEGNKLGDELLRAGRKKESDSVDVVTSFHNDQGNGLDAYAVGPTLGCGAPALMDEGKLVYPYCYKNYKMLENGPLRFSVELEYNPAEVGGNKNVVEHRIISLDKGSNLNRMTVWYTGITKPLDVASGVVVHGQEDKVVLGKNYVTYTDPTDDARQVNSEIYVGCYYPEGQVETVLQKQDHAKGINATHALGIRHQYKGEKFTYYFGAAWSEYDVRSAAEWQIRMDSFIDAQQNPLKVEVK